MSVEFFATESGFTDGLGGASNAQAEGEYHYILFGRQADSQHCGASVTYFEFDDQMNGGTNLVTRIVIQNSVVTFTLTSTETIRIIRQTDEINWQEFLHSIVESFGPALIHT